MRLKSWIWPVTAGAAAVGAWTTRRRQPDRESRAAQAVVAAKLAAAEDAYARLRHRLETTGASPAGAESVAFGGDNTVEIAHEELDALGRLLAEARGASEALAAGAQSVAGIVFEIVASWAQVAVTSGDQKLCTLLMRGRGIQCTDGARADLIGRLQARFPGAPLKLSPGDLQSSGPVSTVDALIDHVSARVP